MVQQCVSLLLLRPTVEHTHVAAAAGTLSITLHQLRVIHYLSNTKS